MLDRLPRHGQTYYSLTSIPFSSTRSASLSLSLSRLSLLPSSLARYIFIPSSVLSVSSPLLLQRRLSLSQQLKLNKRCDASIIDSDRLTLQLSLFS